MSYHILLTLTMRVTCFDKSSWSNSICPALGFLMLSLLVNTLVRDLQFDVQTGIYVQRTVLKLMGNEVDSQNHIAGLKKPMLIGFASIE